MINELVFRLLDRMGYVLIRKKDYHSPARSVLQALALPPIQEAGILAVVDVGASDGRWSLEAAEHFPDARYLLVEANPVHQPALEKLTRKDDRFRCAYVAAADHDGEIGFDLNDAFGGVAVRGDEIAEFGRLPCRRLDGLVQELGLNGPYLLKLDTHGFEVPILSGAQEVLSRTVAVVIEVYNFRQGADGLWFDEMTGWLRKAGFRPADVFDVCHRPGDGLFWQADMLFLREDHDCFLRNKFTPGP